MSANEKVDYNLLYNDLKLAIDNDKMYWVRNDAKIKHIATAKSYDEFRNLVDAAHLTPLTKEDKQKKYQAWNNVVHKE